MNDKMIVLCREVDKNSGNIAVYPLKAEVTNELLLKLSIRSRLNPELKYYTLLTEKSIKFQIYFSYLGEWRFSLEIQAFPPFAVRKILGIS